jgi:hypothetical protein
MLIFFNKGLYVNTPIQCGIVLFNSTQDIFCHHTVDGAADVLDGDET